MGLISLRDRLLKDYVKWNIISIRRLLETVLVITMAGMLPREECIPGLPEDTFTAVRVYEVLGPDTTLFFQWDCNLTGGAYFIFQIPTSGRHLLSMKAVDDGGNESCEYSPWYWRTGNWIPPVLSVPYNEVPDLTTEIFDVTGARTKSTKSGVYFDRVGKKVKKRILLK